MSLDKPNIVDAIGDEKIGGAVTLSIIDAWDWSDEAKHLFALQAKINAYLEFVQSGQLFEVRPSARGKKLKIDIITKFPLSENAAKFINVASQVARQIEIEISHKYTPLDK